MTKWSKIYIIILLIISMYAEHLTKYRKYLKGVGLICAHAWIFILLYMVNTFDLSTVKMHLFIAREILGPRRAP